ncbi:MAG TPA: methyltransferase domain-containing protein [Candidatus Saccharimonadales bacterium]|nr:methyltransferase domain-containing protein [Candidatus Saccharimonadales bacterium]
MLYNALAVNYDIPFVPSSEKSTETMMEVANVSAGELAVDLGAGDGQLVIALAERGAQAVGVEIDKGRSRQAETKILRAGLQDKASIINGSFWEQSLAPYDLIVLYGVPSIMERLQRKVQNEAKHTVRIVSNHFQFPDWQPALRRNNILLYRPFIK